MIAHLVTFSDESMSRAAQLCVRSAETNGVNDSLRWEHELLRHTVFYNENKWMRETARGLGFWAWKPWIIHKLLDFHLTGDQFVRNSITRVQDGDILIYADAGVEFINNANYIIDRMDQDIFLFGNNWPHYAWCKRDIVDEVWPVPACKHDDRVARIAALEKAGRSDILEVVDDLLAGYVSDTQLHDILWDSFGKQCQASVIFFRVSDYSRKFVKEWLDWCLFEGGRLIDDSPSRAPNHPEFRENRHDQAILTTLAYREGIKLHYWPASYNDGAFSYPKLECYAKDDYPILFHHHRRRNHEWMKLGGNF